MTAEDIAKNILLDRTCEHCTMNIDCQFKARIDNTCKHWAKIPELNIQLKSYAFSAKPRKIKMNWTLEDEK